MFKSLTKKNQIDYNKSLEESIGIFYLVPQLLLLNFINLLKSLIILIYLIKINLKKKLFQ